MFNCQHNVHRLNTIKDKRYPGIQVYFSFLFLLFQRSGLISDTCKWHKDLKKSISMKYAINCLVIIQLDYKQGKA